MAGSETDFDPWRAFTIPASGSVGSVSSSRTSTHPRRMSKGIIAVALLVGCAATPDPMIEGGPAPEWDPSKSGKGYPFGSRPQAYTAGVLRPRAAQAAQDTAVKAFYDRWRAQYVTEGCDGYYLRSNGGTGADDAVTVSEAHGYGMLALVIMAGHDPAARATFDGFFRVFRRFPSNINPQLMAWAITAGCRVTAGGDSATDGDLDIAHALLLADRQWGSTGAIDYVGEARRMIAAIDRSEINGDTRLPLLGDWARGPTYLNVTRPSDFMPDHFRGFARVSGQRAWMASIDVAYDLVVRLQKEHSATAGLVPDFVLDTHTTPRVPDGKFLESANDGSYSWNACRVPWRLGADVVLSGDERGRAALAKMSAFIRGKVGGQPARIAEGYRLDGSEISGAGSAAFVAPFAVAAMLDAGSAGQAGQDWLDELWRWLATTPPQGYYADSIRLLSMIVVSGNWWEP